MKVEALDKAATMDRQGKTFVLSPGLLDAAHRSGLRRIDTQLIQAPNESNGQLAIVRAEVYFVDADGISYQFSGIGDASPGNVGRMIAPHIVRMAETRAVARAFRSALNVSYAAFEEMIDGDEDPAPQRPPSRQVNTTTGEVTPAPVADAKQRDQLTRLRKLAGNTVAVPEAIPAVTAANEITALAGRAAGKAARDALASAAQTLKAQTGIDRNGDVTAEAVTLGQVDTRLQSFRAAYAQHQRAAQAPEEQLDPVPA